MIYSLAISGDWFSLSLSPPWRSGGWQWNCSPLNRLLFPLATSPILRYIPKVTSLTQVWLKGPYKYQDTLIHLLSLRKFPTVWGETGTKIKYVFLLINHKITHTHIHTHNRIYIYLMGVHACVCNHYVNSEIVIERNVSSIC